MLPYFQKGNVTIWHGDAVVIQPALGYFDCVVTDPPWEDCMHVGLPGGEDAHETLRRVALEWPNLTDYAVVQLGCLTDPRMLLIPESMPFLRACWLEYVPPRYRGVLLDSADVAYVFGKPRKPERGSVLPGYCAKGVSHGRRRTAHPCERNEIHVRWLVRWFAQGRVLDPFCGSGTTLVACVKEGREVIGIEIEERFCEMAAKRCDVEISQGKLFESDAFQKPRS